MPPVQGVFPTRMTYTLYKGKQVAAQKGYDLLKKKADALAVRLRALLKEIKEVCARCQDKYWCINTSRFMRLVQFLVHS
jgi:vacuolar-type H+-ATPase subunit D/Vma8